MSGPVALTDDRAPDPSTGALAAEIEPSTDPTSALALVQRHPAAFPLPGTGATLTLWESLASVAAVSLTAARAIEPHLDALAILAEARTAGHGMPDTTDSATWGVFAAEGPGVRLAATDPDGDGVVRLHGTSVAAGAGLVVEGRWLALARPRHRLGE